MQAKKQLFVICYCYCYLLNGKITYSDALLGTFICFTHRGECAECG